MVFPMSVILPVCSIFFEDCTIGVLVAAVRGESLSVLASLSSNNSYRYYEFPNARHTARLQAMLELSGQQRMLDMAVKAAFRAQPLANSIYVPNYNVGKISTEQVCNLRIIILIIVISSGHISRMRKVAGSIPVRRCTDLYCASGAQGFIAL